MGSSVLVQVGQCGNQLGESFLEAVFEGTVVGNVGDSEKDSVKTWLEKSSRRNTMFRENKALDLAEEILSVEQRRAGHKDEKKAKPKTALPKRVARAVLIDMEPRVINECLAKKRPWRYDESSCFRLEGGSGNNWAQGYMKHGPQYEEELVELLRREAEMCDWLDSFVIVQSVAGGTGSGVGTFLTESIRDAFPNASRLNCVVWPHASGEVVVQNYNTVLTMSSLQQASTGIVCLFNDDAKYISTRLERNDRPELEDLNRIIARDVASSFLLPSRSCSGRWEGPASVVGFLCSDPAFKCLQSHTVPYMPEQSIAFSSNTWPALLKQAEQAPFGSPMGEKVAFAGEYRVLSRVVTLRGRGAFEFSLQPSMQAGLQSFESQVPSWKRSMDWSCIEVKTEEKALRGHERSISMLSNSQGIIQPLDTVTRKAFSMFQSGAYVHQYERFGMSKDDLVDGFVGVEQILHDYKGCWET